MSPKKATESSSLLDRIDVTAALIGGVIGYIVMGSHIDALWSQPNIAPQLQAAFGRFAYHGLYVYVIFGSALLAYLIVRSIQNIMLISGPSEEEDKAERSSDSYFYDLPVWPITDNDPQLHLVVGEVHDLDGTYVDDPDWYVLPEQGLYTGIAVLGAIGSAKTAGIAYPLTRQLFEYKYFEPENRFGGLFLDAKGDFNNMVEELADEFGRSNDIVKIGPGGEHKWNPLHYPELDADVIASRIFSVYQNMTGDTGTGENAWVQQGAQRLFANAIALIRGAKDYVTFKELNHFLRSFNTKILPEYEKHFKQRELNNIEQRKFRQAHTFFNEEWPNKDKKSQSIFLSSIFNITEMFDKPELAKTFCPKKQEISFPGFDALIDSGAIVVLNMTEAEWGTIAKTVGILLKLDFQRAALHRVRRASQDANTNTSRPLAFVVDEFQEFVTMSEQDGDAKFFSLSRQSKVIPIVLTQDFVSLEAKIGLEQTRKLLQALRNKIFLALEDPDTAKFAADSCGENWQDISSTTIAESARNSSWNPLNSRFSGEQDQISHSHSSSRQRTHIFDPIQFQQLRAFKAIISGFDGANKVIPTAVYLKPYFEDRLLPYNQFIQKFEIGGYPK